MTTEPNDDLTSSDEVEIDLSAGFADDLETASDDVEINLDFGDFSESIERDVELNLDLDGFGDEPEQDDEADGDRDKRLDHGHASRLHVEPLSYCFY